MATSVARRERRAHLRGRRAAMEAVLMRELLEECTCIHQLRPCERCEALDRQLAALESIARAR